MFGEVVKVRLQRVDPRGRQLCFIVIELLLCQMPTEDAGQAGFYQSETYFKCLNVQCVAFLPRGFKGRKCVMEEKCIH